MRDNKELFKNALVSTRKAIVSLEKEGHTGQKLCKREQPRATKNQKLIIYFLYDRIHKTIIWKSTLYSTNLCLLETIIT